MKPLEQIDPVLIDQAVVRVCSDPARPQDKEMAIAQHIAQSREMDEWLKMLVVGPPKELAPALRIRLMTAVTIGMEVGYDLGWREALRKEPLKRKPFR